VPSFRRIARAFLAAGLACLLTGQAGCSGPQPDREGRLLESARRALLDGRFLQAQTAYQSYLQTYPQGSARLEAWQRLVDISEDARSATGQAASLAEAALLEFGGDTQTAAALHVRAAQLRFERKEYAKAVNHCCVVLDNTGAPDNSLLECFLLAARSEIALGQGEKALARYAACGQSRLSASDKARCALAQAELLSRSQRDSEVEPLLQAVFQAAAIDPVLRAQAGFDLGLLYEARNDKAAAKAVYEAVRPLHPNPMVVDKRLDSLQN